MRPKISPERQEYSLENYRILSGTFHNHGQFSLTSHYHSQENKKSTLNYTMNWKRILIVFSAIAAFAFTRCQNATNTENTEADSPDTVQANSQPDSVTAPPEIKYGFNTDSFILEEQKVRRHQFLANILREYDVPYKKINELVQKAKGVFNIRSIRPGNFYCAISSKDTSDGSGCDYFVYEIDPVNYVVFQFKDSVDVYKRQKDVKVEEKAVSGTIEGSLWRTLQERDASPALAVELSEIYAWTVDFYRIRKGDQFKVIYEQKYVEDEFIGIGDIKAAYFKHRGKEHYGFPYEVDGETKYFNDEGESLQKQFLQAPLKYSRISSRYTKKRYHPVLNEYRSHLGTDYAAPTGTPIRAVGDGTVVRARYGKYNGNNVKIRHNSVYSTQYLHMSKIASGIRRGVQVSQEQVIGYVGATGLANGSHLCYRFWKNDRQVDPYKQDIPSSEPIPEEEMDQYLESIKPLRARLDELSLKQPS